MKNPKALNLRRYHQKIYFPPNISQMCVEFFTQLRRVGATHHAVAQMHEDKRGVIPMPSKNDLLHPQNTLVEVYEVLDGKGRPTGIIQKMLIRCHSLSESFDYSYVLAREGFIVSSWANDKGDDHRLTYKYHMYYQPEKNEQDRTTYRKQLAS